MPLKQRRVTFLGFFLCVEFLCFLCCITQAFGILSKVYELETSYLKETTTFGNVFKGFDGFLSSSKNTSNLKRSRKFQLEDRVFSLSSVTSPAVGPVVWGSHIAGLGKNPRFRSYRGLFSVVTLMRVEEIRVGKQDGKLDMVQGRPKVGGSATAGQRKPKKGRTGQREVKRMKLSSDLDPDDKDDVDLR